MAAKRKCPTVPIPPWLQELYARHRHATPKALRKIVNDLRKSAQREMESIYK